MVGCDDALLMLSTANVVEWSVLCLFGYQTRSITLMCRKHLTKRLVSLEQIREKKCFESDLLWALSVKTIIIWAYLFMFGENRVFPSSAFLIASSEVSMIFWVGLSSLHLDWQSVIHFGIFHLQHRIFVKHFGIKLYLQ